LANQLNIDSVLIIGWSDGDVIGLLMGINHLSKVKKILAMGANLLPDSTALYPFAITSTKQSLQKVEAMIQANDTTQHWTLKKQRLDLMDYQPNISKSDLSRIKVPVLIVAGDKDAIGEHSVEIYQNIRKAQLCILSRETHFTPVSNPDVFNKIVEKFIVEPFSRPYSNWTKW
jgi:pimeloyl-ACP methyl ester carboxylesterase